MADLLQETESHSVEELERQVLRFSEATCLRCDVDARNRRRQVRRRYRSWPISVREWGAPQHEEISAALYNGTHLGLAFLSRRPFETGSTLLIRLFWHDDDAPPVPAVVRHATPTENGYLIGCEFDVLRSVSRKRLPRQRIRN